jgi:Dolichyl-phosphate-mannose-protein mannosyltransferase
MMTSDAAALALPPARAGVRAGAGRRRVAAALAMPAIMLLASFAFRAMGLLQAVIDTDEGLYLVQAQAWLRGDWPLISVWDMHPVGAPAMIALSLLAFGESVGAVRLLGILCVAATGWALFGLVRAAGGGRGLAIGAGLLYIAETTQLRGLATNTEILFAPFIAAAMAVATGAASRALRAEAAPRWRELAAAGLLVGTALAIKQVTALEGCLIFALLAFPALWRRVLPLGRFLGMAAAYAALCALPTALFACAYWLRGGLEVFLDTLFVAPFRYSLGRLGPWEALQPISTALATLLWPVLLAGIGVANWFRGRVSAATGPEEGPPDALLARIGLLWFVTGTVAIVGPGYFYPHYFLIWLPSLSVLGALGAASLARLARPRLMPVAFAGILGVTAADAWRSDAAPRLDRGIGIWQADPVEEVAEAIERRAEPGEPVFIVNYHPVVYFLARAGLPTRFVFPAHLSGDFDEVSDIDTDAELSRVLASRPRLVVVDRGWWPQLRPRAATSVTAALQADYILAETVAEERGPVEIWQLR